MAYQLIQGDCLTVLRTMEAKSVHCCVTSPPYFRLRDYGHPDQIGLEPTIGDYVAKMVAVFEEVRRVLRDDGTLWMNLGDSYASTSTYNAPRSSHTANGWKQQGVGPNAKIPAGLKPKDMIGIPWRVAFALQDAGWYLRSDIIWAKSNPMPESVTDRPTKAHEYIFLLSKSERYYYDAVAVAEPAKQWNGKAASFARDGAVGQHVLPGQSAAQHRPDRTDTVDGLTRNRRSVWTVATVPYPGAHFATYPVELVDPCILAGTPAHGVCSVCGAPWVRVSEKHFEPQPDVRDPVKLAKASRKGMDASNGWGDAPRGATSISTLGWQPSCKCGAPAVPATVLDPFNGSGSTGVAAIGAGRNYIGIDVSADYIALAHDRLGKTQPALFGG